MTYTRYIEKILEKHFSKYKQAIILIGARQVGKTTVVKKVFPNAKYLLVDESEVKRNLERYDSSVYRKLIGNNKELIIDEAHLLSDPGRAVKIFYDLFEDLKIIVTGSSSLHIKNKTAESMAGRCIYYHMYPLTIGEYLYQSGAEPELFDDLLIDIIDDKVEETVKTYDFRSIIDYLMIYGLYPSSINLPDDKIYLKNLAQTAIFKDIVELNLISNREKALELLKVLSYQIGNLISYTEISDRLGIDAKTVKRYIDIFEESFLIFRIYPYSKLKRNEIGKTPKIYFVDLGIRNALIENFENLNVRSDIGSMFENFVISEIVKNIKYKSLDWKVNYWRTKSGSEVDLLLNKHDKTIGVEVKYKGGKVSSAFKLRYPNAKTIIVNANNII